MKTHHGVLALSVILLPFASAPSAADAQQRQSRPLEGFNAIEVGGGIELVLRKGDTFAVEVVASEDVAARIVTEVNDKTLRIGRKTNFFHWGDGGTVHVRTIRADDAERLAAFHQGLSRETVYYRFFSPKHSLSEAELRYFTELDYVDRFALVALLDQKLVGVARFDRLDPGDRAEVAFVIDDNQQGRGLGSVLLEHLAQAG